MIVMRVLLVKKKIQENLTGVGGGSNTLNISNDIRGGGLDE